MSRRALRRSQTIDEIVDIAVDVMTEAGAGGLSLSEVARRLGIQQPSLYKYFPSRLALYDRLFAVGQQAYLDQFRAGAATADVGLPALGAAFEAGGRWALATQALAHLMFSRPVPGFVPSEEAFAPSLVMVDLVAVMLRDAVAAGQLRPEAATHEGRAILSVLVTGVMSQQLANEPAQTYDGGSFTRLMPKVLEMFAGYYARKENRHERR
jgi:AcrR family transcriptional regulator